MIPGFTEVTSKVNSVDCGNAGVPLTRKKQINPALLFMADGLSFQAERENHIPRRAAQRSWVSGCSEDHAAGNDRTG